MKRMIEAVALGCLAGVTLQGKAQVITPASEQAKLAGPSHVRAGDSRLRLLFTVKELDSGGKVTNTREFETSLAGELGGGRSSASIRTGARVPMLTGTAGNYTYIDVGVNFDVRAAEVTPDNRVAMHVEAEVSSVDPADKGAPAPLIRQNKWNADELMVLGERSVIFSSDELTSKNRLQIELTVTRAR